MDSRTTLLAVVVLSGMAHAEFKRLQASQATATSFLQSNWNRFQENYHPSYALDDDATTAWVEGAEGDGVGEALTVKLSSLRSARALRLVLTPGYQKTKALFAANGTPTSLEVTVRDVGEAVTGQQVLTVKPAWGKQTFEVPLTGGLSTVTLTVRGVRAGKTYKDTCLSDVQFWVDSDVPYDARVEQAHRTQLLAWKKERLQAARYFAKLPKSWPWQGTHWRSALPRLKRLNKRYARVWYQGDALHTQPEPSFLSLEAWLGDDAATKALPEADLEAVRALLAMVKAPPQGPFFSVAVKDAARTPDGLDWVLPPELWALLRVSELSLFEAGKPGFSLVTRVHAAPGLDREAGLSNLLLLEGTATAPRRALARFDEVIFERADYETSTWVLLEWGEDGLLRRVVQRLVQTEASGGMRNRESGPADPEVNALLGNAVEVVTFTVDAGKVTAVDKRRVEDLERTDSLEQTTSDQGVLEAAGLEQLVWHFTPER